MEEDTALEAAPRDDVLDASIEENRHLALKEGKLDSAIESLLDIEKQLRLSANVVGTRKVVVAIIRSCYEARAWKTLNEQIVLLSKRRAQLKQAVTYTTGVIYVPIWMRLAEMVGSKARGSLTALNVKQAVTAMVQEAMMYVDDAPDQDTRVELIKTLNAVTVGKIYVEIERARLIKKLANIKEGQGLVAEAAELMQEVPVETFGAMSKTEKIAFILEQVRLCLDRKDFMRAQILSRKISSRAFVIETGKEKKKPKEGDNVVVEPPPDVPSLLELKLVYYDLMIRYHFHNNDYLEICRSYQAIYDTPSVKDDATRWIPILRKICWYLVLSPYDSMQASLMHNTLENKKLSELPKFRALLKLFVTMEVIRWDSFWEDYQTEFQETGLPGDFRGEKAKEDLRQRVIEHNILVVSKYYARITLQRLSELLSLSLTDTEKHLSDMVVSKALIAKVDRPAGVVSFQSQKDSNEVLNAWAVSIEKLLELVEKSCHQIHKETMVHKVTLKA